MSFGASHLLPRHPEAGASLTVHQILSLFVGEWLNLSQSCAFGDLGCSCSLMPDHFGGKTYIQRAIVAHLVHTSWIECDCTVLQV